jgi:hypothetical protein
LTNGKHNFPGISSNDAAVLQASRPGGLLAAGKRPNLKSSFMFVTILESPKGALGIDKAVCFGKMNRKEVTYEDQYHKPDRLLQELMFLYQIGQNGGCPKLKAKQMWERLRDMRDPRDGGLMFCHSKRGSWPRNQFCTLCNLEKCGCNGMLPSVKTISEFVNTQTQKRRKKQKAHEVATAVEEVPNSN